MAIDLKKRLVALWYKIPFVLKVYARKEVRRMQRAQKQIEDDIINASNILKKLNANMIAAKWPRAKRKQFWKDFVKHDMFREDVFDQLVKGRVKDNAEGGK